MNLNSTAESVVLHVGGLHWAPTAHGVEQTLLTRPGVLAVDANAISQTATVTFDPTRTDVAELQGWVRECGYHCAGESQPTHVCVPRIEPAGHPGGHAAPDAHARHGGPGATVPHGHGGHDQAASHAAGVVISPHDAMGHGGHGGMSMDAMVADMRNRFLVAAVLSVPITLFSPMGRDILGFGLPAPFGLRDEVFALVLSLPVVFYAGWIFFDGAFRALRNRTLDMMVLVAIAIGAGWLYSLYVTLTGGGEVFFEHRAIPNWHFPAGKWDDFGS